LCDVGDTLYKKFKSVFEPILPKSIHSANIGVDIRVAQPAEVEQAVKQSGDASTNKNLLTVTTDAHASKVIDADTLEPLGVTQQQNLHPSLTGPLSAAHAARDSSTGEVFNYNLAFGAKDIYRIFRANPTTGKVDILAELSGPDFKPAYIHSLFLTKNFVILCIWPAFFPAHGFKLLWEKNLMDAMSPFDPSSKATWCVIDRHHGRGLVKKFQSPAFFSFHSTNAFEESSTTEGEVDITCELVTFENLDILHHLYYDNVISTSPHIANFKKTNSLTNPTLARYKLAAVPLTSTKTNSKICHPAEKILSISTPRAGDLPLINQNFALRPHRYVWSVLDRGKSSFLDGLGKTDTITGECVVWEHEKHTPGEPIFVPRPGAVGEDDGVVLSVVFDGVSGRSHLICLDGASLKEVARAEVEGVVGFGFHGKHIAK
jgi:torulene dioxygenase